MTHRASDLSARIPDTGLVPAPEREQRLGDRAPRRWVRVVARLTVGGAVVMLSLVIVCRAWSTGAVGDVVGSRAFAVTSGSMTPVFEAGDLVVVKRVPARDITVGDIVTFSRADHPNVYITHRVVRIDRLPDGGSALVTKGDANTKSDATAVSSDRVVGVLSHRIPHLGAFLGAYYRGPLLLLFLALLLAAAALKLGKVRIRSDREHSPVDPINKREKRREETP